MPQLDDPNATSVYGVSVDSRSRPPSQPDNKYDIDLGRTLDRVKSVQLGSIQIPDCRYAFDSKSILQYSEPLTMPPNTRLFVQERVHVTDTKTLASTVTTRTVQLLLPPTLNKIEFYDAATNVVTTQYDTGLQFGVQYYPLVGQQMAVVGAHYPQSLMTWPMPMPYPSEAGPILNQATLISNNGYYGPGTDPDITFQYNVAYLNELCTAAPPNHDLRHVIITDDELCAWSYVYAPKLTLVEWFTVLNSALQGLTTAQDVSGNVANMIQLAPGVVQVTTAVPHGLHNYDQVILTNIVGDTALNGSYYVFVSDATTFLIEVAAWAGTYVLGSGNFTSVKKLDGLVEFGFNDRENTVFATCPTLTSTRCNTATITKSYSFVTIKVPSVLSSQVVYLSNYLGFGVRKLDPPVQAQVPLYILRTIQIRPGNYSAPELTAIMNQRMNPLNFTYPNLVTRTLHYNLPTGTPASLIIPCGRYTGAQLAQYLNAIMSAPPGLINVSFNDATGKFTFEQQFGLAFALNFGFEVAQTLLSLNLNIEPVLLALNLGFEPVNYSGSGKYTSVSRAVYGVPSIAPPYGINPYPTNTYQLSADPTQSHFTFDTGDQPQLVVDYGLNDNVVPCSVTWNPLYDCAVPADGVSTTWYPGDVLVARAPFRSGIVTDASNASPIVITTSVAHLLTTGDNVAVSCVQGNTAANGSWFITVTGATTFTLNSSTGNGTFTPGTSGRYITNYVVNDGFGNSGVTNTYTVVVSSSIDFSSGIPSPNGVSLGLEPTVSIFSQLQSTTVHQALLQPNNDDEEGPLRRILLQLLSRDVFMLFFSDPNTKPLNFGFPALAWPPSIKAEQQFNGAAFPTYDSSCGCVPVASSYTAPYCWNLTAPDYIIMVLCNPTGSKDAQTHTYGANTKPIFAKLYITSPYLNIAEQMLFSTFAGYQRINQVSVEFQNPDGTLVEFNGRPHSYTLLFTLYENASETTCF